MSSSFCSRISPSELIDLKSLTARSALPSLVSDPLATLLLLNNLSVAGYLSGGLLNVQGGRWRQALVAALKSVLDSLANRSILSKDDRRILAHTTRLLPALASDSAEFVPSIVTLIEKVAPDAKGKSAEVATSEWQAGDVWNDGHLLATLLRCASDLLVRNSDIEPLLLRCLVEGGLLRRVLEVYHWNGEIMDQIAILVDRWSTSMQ